MSILLSHTTALEALRRWDLRKRLARGQRCAAVVPSRVDEGDAPFATGSLLDGLTKPLHALVSDRRAALETPTIHAHLQSGPLPDESAISLSEGVLCCSPEHVVVQLAPHLTVIELAYLLSELMGTYAVNDAMEDGMFQRDEPLTTPDRILRHLGKLGRCAGTGMVRRACPGLRAFGLPARNQACDATWSQAWAWGIQPQRLVPERANGSAAHLRRNE